MKRSSGLQLTHDDVRGIRARLMAKVVRGATPDECWGWTASTSVDGYARIGGTGAHRISYALFVCDIPEGMTIDHLCRNRSCVNPWHLEAVPLVVNVMRGGGICVQHSARETCANGHELVYVQYGNTRGQRLCPTCKRENQNAWQRRKRAAQRAAR